MFFADSLKTVARSAAGFWGTFVGNPCATFGKKKLIRAHSYQTGLSGVLHFFSRHFSMVNKIFNKKKNAGIESISLTKLGAVEITDFDMHVFVKNRLVSREI